MTENKRLVWGVTFFLASPLLPVLITFPGPNLPFLDEHLGVFYFVSAILSAVGMALLILPYYRESKRLEQKYRWIDKCLALPFFLLSALAISALFSGWSDPSPFIGFSLLFFYIHRILLIGILLLWGYGMAFSKGKIAIIAILCCAAFFNMPRPQINNPYFHQMMQEQESQWRALTNEEIEELGPSAEDIKAVKVSQDDDKDIEYQRSSKTVSMGDEGYIILLALYTFMRFSRKKEEVVVEEPDDNNDEALPSADG